MTRRSQTLYRDTNDRMIAGVCSGLGHYFDIDTTLVRVAFVVFTLLGGGGVLAYLLLAVILDPAPLPSPSLDAPPPPIPPGDRVEPPVAAGTDREPVIAPPTSGPADVDSPLPEPEDDGPVDDAPAEGDDPGTTTA